MKDIECPYCGKEQDINHDDGYGYEEGVLHEQECGFCDKTFTYNTSISFYHEAYKADCLNGSEHEFQRNWTYPRQFTKMKCNHCEAERNPTEDEMKKILEEDPSPSVHHQGAQG